MSAYPKNEPVIPPEEPPIIPPTPDKVSGYFRIIKHDSESTDIVLRGAEFAVYRPATESDENTEIIECNGMNCVVVPVVIDGKPLVIVTDKDGQAISPELACGTYYLAETKAPAGYHQSEEVSVVTVTSNLVEEETFYIAKEKGVLLPETGGVGTTGFMIVGGIMMVTAIVLFDVCICAIINIIMILS